MTGGHSGLKPGAVARFGLAITGNGVTQTAAAQVGVTTNVGIEGDLVSVSPLVVSVKGLPLTITVPAGVTLPSGLAPGMHVELTVSVGDGNALTLVSVGGQTAGESNQTAGDNNQTGAGDDQADDQDDDQGDNQDDQGDDDGSGSSGSSGSGHSSSFGSGGGGDD